MATIIFYDAGFPYEGAAPDEAALRDLRRSGRVVDAAGLAEALEAEDAGTLVHLHGPYFPKDAWPAISRHLGAGKGWVHAGGAPFKRPVGLTAEGWAAEPEMTAYHQEIHIHEALVADGTRAASLRHNPERPLLAGSEALFDIGETYGLVLHVTHERDQLNQATGSSGPMNARIQPLLVGVSPEGREVTAPVVLLERFRGDFAGGRWLLANQRLTARFWSGGGAAALLRWADYCQAGVTELWLKPSYAAYHAGETPHLTVQAQRITPAGGIAREPEEWRLRISLRKRAAPEHEREAAKAAGLNQDTQAVASQSGPAAQTASSESDDLYADPHIAAIASSLDVRAAMSEVDALWQEELDLSVGSEIAYVNFVAPVALEPGSYAIACEAVSASGERRLLHQGFWCYDRELLRRGAPLAAGRDYFIKDGKPFPVVGMTYMASDTGRKFINLPNPAIWDRDMATMKRAGINWIRTGMWSAWRHLMFEDGHASEEQLRAIDAFILTAARHGLEVTFTFFAFAPEAWEGRNPYLDPRSVQAQKRFIAAIVSRHKDTSNVQWDLINEPSLFDPTRIFTGPRAVHDKFERQAFGQWLQERHGMIDRLQARWNMTQAELPDFSSAEPPEQTDIAFDIHDIKRLKKNGRWLDYTLFTMDMHNRWVEALSATIRTHVPGHLVTVGQDEALGRGPRPSPFMYAQSVDYTNVHTWWLNDQLLWDGLFGKDPSKPALIQETGIMYVEMPDNRAKRTEEELRNLLERKYAYAFAGGSAGAVHWLWNTNYFMDNVCESNIGALRADGTEKPEADVSYDFGRFIGSISDLFADRELADIAVVFPYTNDFSSRRFACEASQSLTRVLAYDMKVPFYGISELHLDSLSADKPRLIIVPSAHSFSDEALEKLLGHVEMHGGTLLFTGPIGLDAYWKPTSRAARAVGAAYRLTNLSREEQVRIAGRTYRASFGDRKIGQLNKEVVPGADGNGWSQTAELLVRPLGAGKLLWCPLPLELNERTDTLQALYAAALQEAQAGSGAMAWEKGGDHPGVYGTRLTFKHGSLYIFISESGADCEVAIRDGETSYRFTVPSERSVLFATDAQGGLIATYRDTVVSQSGRVAGAEEKKAAGELS
ncbi:beta-galactosidase [Cohnella hashimotonis]|uniref:Beta-galactosidase n=1 Tax=Cohnella hashimotonis TaxID=2826895 RepID=A0ABT6TP62_9BACL|nr:beta-galactosidase [Cohnella hashimotonis]MDI4648085.1 beta-galactosidase [Cohnella hashimotonis]